MNKKMWIASAGILLFAGFLGNCGGGGTSSTVCGALADQTFKVCSADNANDVDLIFNTLTNLNFTITKAEIQSASKSDLKSACEDQLNSADTKLTSDEATAIADGVKATTTCEGLMAYVQQVANS